MQEPYCAHLSGLGVVVGPVGLGVVVPAVGGCNKFYHKIFDMSLVYKTQCDIDKGKPAYRVAILVVFIANWSVSTIDSFWPITPSIYRVKTFLFSIDYKCKNIHVKHDFILRANIF